MLKLYRYFHNNFDGDRVSKNRLLKLAGYHISQLRVVDRDRQYADLLAEIQPLYDAYVRALSLEDSTYARQQGETIAVRNIVGAFKQAVSRYEGHVRGYLGKGSPEYEAFFPLGVGEYFRGSLKNLALLMNRFEKIANKYMEEMGPELYEKIRALRLEFTEHRRRQLILMAKVSDHRGEVAALKAKLSAQLTRNLLRIASDNVGHPERAKLYFSNQ